MAIAKMGVSGFVKKIFDKCPAIFFSFSSFIPKSPLVFYKIILYDKI
jgi:hypothetical protein